MFSKTQTALLTVFFGCFVVFLYGPVLSIILLAFQGPEGGLTFPMRGVSLHWFEELWRGLGVVDISRALRRSLFLGVLVMIFTVVLSLCAGLAFRKKFRGSGFLFYLTIARLIIPSIAISLGIALQFRLLDETIKWLGQTLEIQWIVNDFQTSMGLIASGLGTHLTWTLPFGLLIMFAVFNRFNPSYEEAARDLGATPWQTFWGVVFPLIAPALVGVALFGFTLSYDELARSSQALGAVNTLPLELRGLTTTVTNPSIYALGAVTTGVSFLVIGISLALFWALRRKIGTGR
jgi:putative spermidine/putrescine transport system permease protein